MEHVKKCWPPYFEAILTGDKKFEIRLADFNTEPGDILVLQEWDNETKQYTGRQLRMKINYVAKTKQLDFWSAEEIDKYGYQVLSLEDVYTMLPWATHLDKQTKFKSADCILWRYKYRCLKCGNVFWSDDRLHIAMCQVCRLHHLGVPIDEEQKPAGESSSIIDKHFSKILSRLRR